MRGLTFTDLAGLRPGKGCVVCGKHATTGGLAVGCEQCGALVHAKCYFTAVASTAERVTLELTEEPYSFLCRGCRS